MKPVLLVPGRPVFKNFVILALFSFFSAAFVARAQCPPVITSIPPSASVCAGDSVQLSCQPSTGTTWQWYLNGSPIPSATGSTYYAKTDGNYTVMTGSCGLPSNPVAISMMPLPFVAINILSNDTICNGQNVSLSVNTGANVQWVWLQPTGLLGQTTNPYTGTINFTTTFQVVAVDQTTTCANTATVTIPVIPVIFAGTLFSDDTICIGDTPNLITGTAASGGTGTYTYQWEISTTSATTGYSVIPGATGLNYQPGATFVNTWFRRRTSSPPCPDTYSNVVRAIVIPTPVITSALTKTICSGTSVNYTPTSNVAGSTFAWTATVTSGTVTGLVASGNGPINTVLSVPAGSVAAGVVTYHITPTGPALTYCPGIASDLIVTILPTPVITNAPLTEDICAGNTTTPVAWTSNVAGATFSWTASATPGLSGYQVSGTSNLPAMQIFSTLMADGTVTYTVTPTGPAPNNCPGTPSTYTITVHPSPTVTNTPLSQSICSGSTTTAVNLTSNVSGTNFTWTATAVPPSITGYQVSGTNSIPAQTIFNPSASTGVVTYHILPSGNINGCAGIPRDYDIFITPIPDVIATPASQTICSGMTTGILLSSSVTNTTFSWTASAPSSILGFSNGTGNSILQTLTNTSNANHDVTYVITPTSNGCVGNSITVTVTVVPAPNLTVIPTTQFTCSGTPVTINLTASLPGVAFSWTASGTGNVFVFYLR